MYNLLWVYARVEPLLYIIGGQHRQQGEFCQPIGAKYVEALIGTLGFPGERDSDKDRKAAIVRIGSSKNIRSRSNPNFQKKDSGRYRGLNICPWLSGRAKRKQAVDIERVTERLGKVLKLGKTEALTGQGLAGTRTRKDVGVNSDTTVEFRIHENTLDAEKVLNWAQICALIVDWSAKESRAEVLALPKGSLRALVKIAPDHKDFILHKLKSWRLQYSPKRRLIATKPGGWLCVGLPDSSE